MWLLITNCFRLPVIEKTGIRIKSFEDLRSFFQPTVRSMIHCAVQRNFLSNYMHYYIVLGHTWHKSCKNCYIIHVSFRGKSSMEWVKQELYSKEQNKNDIKKGLYMYQNDEYPKNDEDFSKAHDRFRERWGETDNSNSRKKCKHHLAYILTGCSGLSCQRRSLSNFKDLFTERWYKTIYIYIHF